MAWVDLIRCGLTIAAVVVFSGHSIADTLTKDEAARLIRDNKGFPTHVCNMSTAISAETQDSRGNYIPKEPLFSVMQQIAAESACHCDGYGKCRDIFNWCRVNNIKGKKVTFYNGICAYDQDIKIESIKTIDKRAVISYKTYLKRNKHGNQLMDMAQSSMVSAENDLFGGYHMQCIKSSGSERCDYWAEPYPSTVYATKYDQGWDLN